MELPSDPSAPAAEPEPTPAAPATGAAGPGVSTDRLSTALDRLVDRGVLHRSQAGAVLLELDLAPQPQPARAGGLGRLLGEIAGYLGASFVVGATLLFLSEEWEALGRAGRFGILAGMAVILGVSGVAIRWWSAPDGPAWWRRQSGDSVRRRLSSTLLTGAAAAAGFAAYVSLELPPSIYDGDPPADPAWFVASATALAVVILGYLLARSAVGQLGMAVAAFAVYVALLDLLDATDTAAIGLGTLALGALWAVLAWRRLFAERRFALAIAVTFGLLGAQLVVIDGNETQNFLGYALTALVAGICFTAYARLRDWVVLAGGVVGATLVVPEFLYDVTDGSLGASGVLLVAGVTLLGGSLAGLNIRRHSGPGPAPTAP